MLSKLFCGLFLLITINLEAQQPQNNIYDRYLHTENQPLAYDQLHESKITYEKTVERTINLSEKKNHFFLAEKGALIDVLTQAAKEGELKMFDPSTDRPLTQAEIEELVIRRDTAFICVDGAEDFGYGLAQEVGGYVWNGFVVKVYEDIIGVEDVGSFKVREVQYFDQNSSQMKTRVVAIAPVIDRYDGNGNFLFSIPMFWVDYNHARKVLAQAEAANPNNDAQRMTWEDVFEMHYYSSTIIKESNIFDRRIQDYTEKENALFEADRISSNMFTEEQSCWSY